MANQKASTLDRELPTDEDEDEHELGPSPSTCACRA
jgi:hypothetical protein